MKLKEVNSIPLFGFGTAIVIMIIAVGYSAWKDGSRITPTLELETGYSEKFRGIHLGGFMTSPGPETDVALFEVPDYLVEENGYGRYIEIVTEKARYRVRIDEVALTSKAEDYPKPGGFDGEIHVSLDKVGKLDCVWIWNVEDNDWIALGGPGCPLDEDIEKEEVDCAEHRCVWFWCEELGAWIPPNVEGCEEVKK